MEKKPEGEHPVLRPMSARDWPAVREIFAQGIATGNATFEAQVPDWEAWDAGHLRHCRIVVESDGRIAGWAALRPVSSRTVYAGVGEISVYVAADVRGRGLGTLLLRELVQDSERHGLWTLQAGIFPENEASIALHRRCGFRFVGRREKLGRMQGRWRDVLLLERRSSSVGIATQARTASMGTMDAVTEATLETVRRFNTAFDRHDADAVMAAMTEDCVFDSTRPAPDGERFEGQKAVRAFWKEFFRRSPQARFEAEEIFAAGDRCVVRWVYHWMKEGKPGHVRGIDVFRVREGKVAEKLSYVKG